MEQDERKAAGSSRWGVLACQEIGEKCRGPVWEWEGLFLTLQSSFQAPLPLVSLVWVASVLSALSTCPSGFFTSHLHLNTQAQQCKDLVQGMKMTKRRNTELGMEGRRQDTSSTGGTLSLSELSSPITYTPQSST